MPKSDTNKKLSLSSLYQLDQDPNIQLYNKIIINYYNSIEPEKQFKLRELVNWLLENYSPFISEFRGDKTPKSYRAQQKTSFVKKRLYDLIRLKLIEEYERVESDKNDLETIIYKFTEMGKIVHNILYSFDKPSINLNTKKQFLRDMMAYSTKTLPFPDDEPPYRFLKLSLELAVYHDIDFMFCVLIYMLLHPRVTMLTPFSLGLFQPERNILFLKNIKRLLYTQFDENDRKIVLHIIKSSIEDYTYRSISKNYLNTLNDADFGKKWLTHKIQFVQNFVFVGHARCDSCDKEFPQAINILLDDRISSEYEKLKKEKYGDYDPVEHCPLCEKSGTVRCASVDVYYGYLDMITEKKYASFLFKLLENPDLILE